MSNQWPRGAFALNMSKSIVTKITKSEINLVNKLIPTSFPVQKIHIIPIKNSSWIGIGIVMNKVWA